MNTNPSKINTIIWDWNGTLLDDTDLCIDTINVLLSQRNLANLDKQSYLGVFGFPVKDYYQRIGFDFDKEPFELPAHEYIEIYSSMVEKCMLHQGVQETLAYFASLQFNQMVLSASEQQKLVELLENFDIRQWFIDVAGLDNHFAQSKTAIGVKMLKKQGIKAETACLIGDTTHDFEVAQTLGCQCILISNGHQSSEKLKETGALVLDDLRKLSDYFKK